VSTRGTPLQIKKIVGLFPELLGVGGVQEVGRLTGAALREIAGSRGWATEFLSLNDSPESDSFNVGGRDIPFHGFGRAKVPFTLAGIRGARSLTRGEGGIVLAAHPNLALPALWMRRICPHLKTIVMSHGIEVWKPLPCLRRRALAAADAVFAPSGDTARKLIEVQIVASAKVRKLAWPINPTLFRMADAPGGLSPPVSFPQGRVILTVGRWATSERYKGTDELIRAVAQLRREISDLHLVAVGGGDDLPRLRRLAADLEVTDRVHFLANLSRQELAACYSRCDIFALPSSGEGFGLVFLEAMVFERPVVAAGCGGTTDLVEDGVNGLLIPPHDGERLVRALSRLLNDETLCVHLGRRAAEMVRKMYSFDCFRANLEATLENCILRE